MAMPLVWSNPSQLSHPSTILIKLIELKSNWKSNQLLIELALGPSLAREGWSFEFLCYTGSIICLHCQVDQQGSTILHIYMFLLMWFSIHLEVRKMSHKRLLRGYAQIIAIL